MNTVVLDAGYLIALERRDRRALALLRELVAARASAHVSAAVIAQVWCGSPRQHSIRRLLKANAVRVHPLTEGVAYRVGPLLASAKSSDVVDAHVAILGRALGASVVTSDPADLQRLDAGLSVVAI